MNGIAFFIDRTIPPYEKLDCKCENGSGGCLTVKRDENRQTSIKAGRQTENCRKNTNKLTNELRYTMGLIKKKKKTSSFDRSCIQRDPRSRRVKNQPARRLDRSRGKKANRCPKQWYWWTMLHREDMCFVSVVVDTMRTNMRGAIDEQTRRGQNWW